MKNCCKVFACVTLAFFLFIAGFGIFSGKYTGGFPVFILFSILLVFILLIFTIYNDLQQTIKIDKLEKLDDTFCRLQGITKISGKNKKTNDFEKYFSELKDLCNKNAKELEKLIAFKCGDLKSPFDGYDDLEKKKLESQEKVDMFKAYANAIVEI